jgi:hypothetical protein
MDGRLNINMAQKGQLQLASSSSPYQTTSLVGVQRPHSDLHR